MSLSGCFDVTLWFPCCSHPWDSRVASLSAGELPEIRALMLERLARHQEALELYLYDLHDLRSAEAYCDRCERYTSRHTHVTHVAPQ